MGFKVLTNSKLQKIRSKDKTYIFQKSEVLRLQKKNEERALLLEKMREER